jgi:enoyl-CoA hydratase
MAVVNMVNEGRYRLITINRPQQLNALNKQVFDELHAAVLAINAQSDCRGVIVTGAGEKAFVAGADIEELARADSQEAMQIARRGQQVFQSITELNVPVIAAINGFALGGGLELAMACHLRIAETHARLGQPESKLGLIPGYGGTQKLARLIGMGRALEMLLSGEMIDAARAELFGLVNRVVPAGSAVAEAINMLEQMARNAPRANARILTSTITGMELPLTQALLLEANAFANCFADPEKEEGTRAFLEKRQADFSR